MVIQFRLSLSTKVHVVPYSPTNPNKEVKTGRTRQMTLIIVTDFRILCFGDMTFLSSSNCLSFTLTASIIEQQDGRLLLLSHKHRTMLCRQHLPALIQRSLEKNSHCPLFTLTVFCMVFLCSIVCSFHFIMQWFSSKWKECSRFSFACLSPLLDGSGNLKHF